MRVDVYFESGRDVLNAYWGYISGGGLMIPSKDGIHSSPELRTGQKVTVQVNIGPRSRSHDRPRRQCSVHGRIARADCDETVIAFDTEESQSQLLSAALSEQPVDFQAHLTLRDYPPESMTPSHLFELSEDGCCLRLPPDRSSSYPVGSEIVIEAADFCISGCVVASSGCERYVIFGFGDEVATRAVRACLDSAVRAA